jgi:hypothetical protein
MNKKIFYSIIIGILLVAILSACGGQQAPSYDPPTPPTPAVRCTRCDLLTPEGQIIESTPMAGYECAEGSTSCCGEITCFEGDQIKSLCAIEGVYTVRMHCSDGTSQTHDLDEIINFDSPENNDGSQCLGIVNPSPHEESLVFLTGDSDSENRCCGNNEEDSGWTSTNNVNLCYGEQWIPYSEGPLVGAVYYTDYQWKNAQQNKNIIFSIEKPETEFDVISTGDVWHFCSYAPPQTHTTNKISPGNTIEYNPGSPTNQLIESSFHLNELALIENINSIHTISSPGSSCTDYDGDGFDTCEPKVDCDDNNFFIHPNAVEIKDDGIDSNCDESDNAGAIERGTTLNNIICYSSNNIHKFAECAGQSFKNSFNSIDNTRKTGEPTFLLEDFSAGCYSGQDCVFTLGIEDKPGESYKVLRIEDMQLNLHDWSSFDSLNFFAFLTDDYEARIALGSLTGTQIDSIDSYTKVFDAPISDYAINSKNLKQWMFISIPLSNIQTTDIDAIIIYANSEKAEAFGDNQVPINNGNLNSISVDRFFLLKSNSDSSQFCTADFSWVNYFDSDKSVCSAQPAFQWIGNTCCGDGLFTYAQDSEYRLDTEGACWNNNPLTEKAATNVEFKIGDQTFTETCTENNCLIPLSTKATQNIQPIAVNLPITFTLTLRQTEEVPQTTQVTLSSPQKTNTFNEFLGIYIAGELGSVPSEISFTLLDDTPTELVIDIINPSGQSLNIPLTLTKTSDPTKFYLDDETSEIFLSRICAEQTATYESYSGSNLELELPTLTPTSLPSSEDPAITRALGELQCTQILAPITETEDLSTTISPTQTVNYQNSIDLGSANALLSETQGAIPLHYSITSFDPRLNIKFLSSNRQTTSNTSDKILVSTNYFETTQSSQQQSDFVVQNLYEDEYDLSILLPDGSKQSAKPTAIFSPSSENPTAQILIETPLHILYNSEDDKIYTCHAPDHLSQKLSLFDQNKIVNIDEECKIVGAYFCGPFGFVSQDSHGITVQERNTSKSIPEGIEDIAGISRFNQMSCCPQDYCWDGENCISPEVDATELPSFHEIGESYKCYNGEWNNVNISFDLNDQPGYCPSSTQCLADINGNPENNNNPELFQGMGNIENPQCIESGTYIEDNICYNSQWTSRTRDIALQMLNFSQEESPNNHILYCDSYDKLLNIYEYQTPSLQRNALEYIAGNRIMDITGEKTCSDLDYKQPCVNNFCVLRTEQGVLLGTSLNKEADDSEISFLDLVVNDEDFCNNIDDDKNQSFQFCGEKNGNRVWLKKDSNTLIFTKNQISITSLTAFERFRISPIQSIINFVKNIIQPEKETLIGIEPIDFSLAQQITDFNRIYQAKVNQKQVKAIIEIVNQTELMTISYSGIQGFDICSAVERYGEANSIVVTCDLDAGTYYITSDAPKSQKQQYQLWEQLTGRLRLD